MIDWHSVLVSILATTTIVGAISFVLKKTFEKTLATKFKEIENKQKLILEETMRRKAKIYDEQFDFYKTALGLIYQVRNSSREVYNNIRSREKNIITIKEGLDQVNKNFHSFSKILTNNRAIVSDLLFEPLHDMRNSIIQFQHKSYMITEQMSSNDNYDLGREDLKSLQSSYTNIDNGYIKCVQNIQVQLVLNPIDSSLQISL